MTHLGWVFPLRFETKQYGTAPDSNELGDSHIIEADNVYRSGTHFGGRCKDRVERMRNRRDMLCERLTISAILNTYRNITVDLQGEIKMIFDAGKKLEVEGQISAGFVSAQVIILEIRVARKLP